MKNISQVEIEEASKKEDQPEKHRETTVEFLASLASVLVTGLFIITFIVQAFEIPSSSMEDTLLIGDHVFVNRIQFSPQSKWIGPIVPYRNIRRGDIVVFLSPAEPGLYVVKRIIGVPGDRIHLRDGQVYRNGENLRTAISPWATTGMSAMTAAFGVSFQRKTSLADRCSFTGHLKPHRINTRRPRSASALDSWPR